MLCTATTTVPTYNNIHYCRAIDVFKLQNHPYFSHFSDLVWWVLDHVSKATFFSAQHTKPRVFDFCGVVVQRNAQFSYQSGTQLINNPTAIVPTAKG